MSVDIRVQSVKPLRNTFAHIAARFGDKPATRYQEGTYHLQAEVNFHYKPLWDPERDIWDKRRTAVVMQDWYAPKDPRQYYYGSYTIARSRMQEAADRQMELADKRGLLAGLPEAARQDLINFIVPLRHFEWGGNTNFAHVAAYGWGTAITQAAAMGMMDRLGVAQHLSRIGLMLDGNTGASLVQAKRQWVGAPHWQPLRREIESVFVRRDWFETLVAQALVADHVVYGLMLQRFEGEFAKQHGSALATVLDFPLRWQEEHARWVDAVVKTCAAESEANRTLIAGWARQWQTAFVAALAPLAETALGRDGAAALKQVSDELSVRLGKLGLA
jgi:phenol hydroxylase P1 protein